MSLSAALILVVLVSLSSAVPLKETCRKLPAKHHFDVKAYYSGKWYGTHAYSPSMPKGTNLGVCAITKAEILQTLVREVYSVYVPDVDEYMYSEGFIALHDFEKGVAKFVEEVRIVDKDGKPLIKEFVAEPLTIIDTDYKNYSIVYFCTEQNDGKLLSSYSILSRVQDPEQVHPNVEVVLNRLGLKLEDFASNKGLNCKEDPNF
uniref:Triabin-like protein 3 n=1 Tax=Pristhesancus plagipennis TaxID=1955184 RepID=A0A1Q1NP39_PRIPG|nr:triabin-like protein 3 [Pristhesancus plagipennis]